MVILNRVESPGFPDSISEVIFQKSGRTYQFSPVIPGGRWYKVEPNSECYEVVDEVLNGIENYKVISDGAVYFESCKGSSWHSRNLRFLYKSDNIRFYRRY